ncbi:hypothetical protein GCM10009864_66830 [Streptomyces lunalinharesii]|uniref:Metallopeptidase family protein n=1 Tax=Streptomyces lunalinharesii TaxID=333384 RepID=A0ABN3STA2_9ACTN
MRPGGSGYRGGGGPGSGGGGGLASRGGVSGSARRGPLVPYARCAVRHAERAGSARGRAAVTDNGGVLEMTREEFEELVAEALDRIPPELTRLMDNVAVFVEDEPPADDPDLLGLYEGTPLTDRGEWYAGVLPDRITIYRGPTLRMCDTREDVVAETEVTVVHEVAHHFGIDDARLHALGYG